MTDASTGSSPASGPAPTAGTPRRWLPWALGAVALVGVVAVVALLVTRDEDVSTTGSSITTTSSTTTTTGPSGSSTEPPATSGDTGSTVPATTDGIDTMPGAGTTPVSVPPPAIETAQLTDVRVGRHEGYDRVVFVFDGELPGYEVRYAELPVREDGSGEPVELAGAHALTVRMTPASGVRLVPDGFERTYTGPSRLPGTGAEITEVVEAGDFEAQLTWAIGLQDRVDFRVSALSGPTRLVVDVRNH